MYIAQCPCCKGFYPCPPNWGWAGKLVCVECEAVLTIDPVYPYLPYAPEIAEYHRILSKINPQPSDAQNIEHSNPTEKG